MREYMSESCAEFGDETLAGSETNKQTTKKITKKALRVMAKKRLGAACCVEAYLLSPLLCMHPLYTYRNKQKPDRQNYKPSSLP